MKVVRAIWKGGKVVLLGKPDWPEGTELMVEVDPPGLRFMTEDEQGDDPESIRRWIEEVNALPAPDVPNPFDDPEWIAWEAKVAQYNFEAVRKQFLEEQP